MSHAFIFAWSAIFVNKVWFQLPLKWGLYGTTWDQNEINVTSTFSIDPNTKCFQNKFCSLSAILIVLMYVKHVKTWKYALDLHNYWTCKVKSVISIICSMTINDYFYRWISQSLCPCYSVLQKTMNMQTFWTWHLFAVTHVSRWRM